MSIEDTIRGLRNDNQIALEKQEKERLEFFDKFEKIKRTEKTNIVIKLGKKEFIAPYL